MNLTAKRFGVKRLILDDMGYTDSFSIPAGHRITYVVAETKGVMLGTNTFSLGTSESTIESAAFSVTNVQVAATPATAVYTVTAGMPAPGNATLGGVSVAMANEDGTAALAATKLFDGVKNDAGLSGAWTITNSAPGEVTFVAKAAGVMGDITFDAGTTGITGAVVVNPQGADATAETATFKVTAFPTALGKIKIAGKELTMNPSVHTTVQLAAQSIAGASYDEYNAAIGTGVDDDTVFFTAKEPGAKTNMTFFDGNTGAAATVTTDSEGGEAANEIQKITVDTAPTAAGYLLIAGVYVPVDPATETTVALTAAAIYNNPTAYAGWTTSYTPGDAFVTFTADSFGNKDPITFSNGTTGVTGTLNVTDGADAITETAVLTMTGGVPASSGTVVIAGRSYTLTGADDTVNEAAATLAAAIEADGSAVWGAVADGAVLTLTSDTAGSVVTTPGAADVSGATGVAISGPVFTAGLDAAVTGDLTVAGETVTLAAGDILTPTTVATKIAAHTFEDWDVARVDAGLTFTAKGEGNQTNVTIVPLTGITFSEVVTTEGTSHVELVAPAVLNNAAGSLADLTVVANVCYAPTAAAKDIYINLFDAPLVNNVRLYVGMEKYI